MSDQDNVLSRPLPGPRDPAWVEFATQSLLYTQEQLQALEETMNDALTVISVTRGLVEKHTLPPTPRGCDSPYERLAREQLHLHRYHKSALGLIASSIQCATQEASLAFAAAPASPTGMCSSHTLARADIVEFHARAAIAAALEAHQAIAAFQGEAGSVKESVREYATELGLLHSTEEEEEPEDPPTA